MMYERLDKKIPLKDLDQIVDGVFDIISDTVHKGEEVQISGFGSFSVPERITKPLVRVRKVVNVKDD